MGSRFAIAIILCLFSYRSAHARVPAEPPPSPSSPELAAYLAKNQDYLKQAEEIEAKAADLAQLPSDWIQDLKADTSNPASIDQWIQRIENIEWKKVKPVDYRKLFERETAKIRDAAFQARKIYYWTQQCLSPGKEKRPAECGIEWDAQAKAIKSPEQRAMLQAIPRSLSQYRRELELLEIIWNCYLDRLDFARRHSVFLGTAEACHPDSLFPLSNDQMGYFGTLIKNVFTPKFQRDPSKCTQPPELDAKSSFFHPLVSLDVSKLTQPPKPLPPIASHPTFGGTDPARPGSKASAGNKDQTKLSRRELNRLKRLPRCERLEASGKIAKPYVNCLQTADVILLTDQQKAEMEKIRELLPPKHYTPPEAPPQPPTPPKLNPESKNLDRAPALPSRAELVKEGGEALKRYQKTGELGLDIGTFLIQWREHEHWFGVGKDRYKKTVIAWQDHVTEYKQVIQQTPGTIVDKAQALQALLFAQGLKHYRVDKKDLESFLAGEGGNCQTRTQAFVSAMLLSEELLKDSQWKVGIELYEDHVTPVLYNSKTRETLDLVSGDYQKVPQSKVFKAPYLLHAALKKKGKSPLTDDDMILDAGLPPTDQDKSLIAKLKAGTGSLWTKLKNFAGFDEIFDFAKTGKLYTDGPPPARSESDSPNLKASLAAKHDTSSAPPQHLSEGTGAGWSGFLQGLLDRKPDERGLGKLPDGISIDDLPPEDRAAAKKALEASGSDFIDTWPLTKSLPPGSTLLNSSEKEGQALFKSPRSASLYQHMSTAEERAKFLESLASRHVENGDLTNINLLKTWLADPKVLAAVNPKDMHEALESSRRVLGAYEPLSAMLSEFANKEANPSTDPAVFAAICKQKILALKASLSPESQKLETWASRKDQILQDFLNQLTSYSRQLKGVLSTSRLQEHLGLLIESAPYWTLNPAALQGLEKEAFGNTAPPLLGLPPTEHGGPPVPTLHTGQGPGASDSSSRATSQDLPHKGRAGSAEGVLDPVSARSQATLRPTMKMKAVLFAASVAASNGGYSETDFIKSHAKDWDAQVSEYLLAQNIRPEQERPKSLSIHIADLLRSLDKIRGSRIQAGDTSQWIPEPPHLLFSSFAGKSIPVDLARLLYALIQRDRAGLAVPYWKFLTDYADTVLRPALLQRGALPPLAAPEAPTPASTGGPQPPAGRVTSGGMMSGGRM